MQIPLAIGLLGRDGRELPLTLPTAQTVERGVLRARRAAQSFTFTDVAERAGALAQPRLLGAGQAASPISRADDLRLMAAHDGDPFNRWQAVQTLATRLLVGNVARLRAGQDPELDEGLLDALAAILADDSLEPAFVAEALAAAERGGHRPRDRPRRRSRRDLPRAHGAAHADGPASQRGADAKPIESLVDRKPYSPDADSAGRRLLKNVCLDLLAATQESHAIRLAATQYKSADNMTDRMAALATLSLHDVPERQAALDDFYERYQSDPLIIDKWFVLQATTPDPKTLDRVKALTGHAAFSMSNPNRVRSLITSFAAGNPTQFNRAGRRGLRVHRRQDPGARSGQSAGGVADVHRVPELARARSGTARAGAGGAEADCGCAAAVARRRRHRAARAGGELEPRVSFQDATSASSPAFVPAKAGPAPPTAIPPLGYWISRFRGNERYPHRLYNLANFAIDAISGFPGETENADPEHQSDARAGRICREGGQNGRIPECE